MPAIAVARLTEVAEVRWILLNSPPAPLAVMVAVERRTITVFTLDHSAVALVPVVDTPDVQSES